MDVEKFKQKYEELKDNPMYKNFCSILDTKNQVLERIARENQELKNSLERYQKELNEENLLCSKYAIEINDLKEKLEQCSAVADTNSELADSISEHYKRQQQEFIEWLEQKLKKYTPNLRVNEFDEYDNRIAQYINAEVYEISPEDVVKDVLSKYKETIGGLDEQ